MLRQLLTDLMGELQKALRDSLEAQGHVLTGRLQESIDFEIEASPNEITGIMYIEDYGLYVEAGVKAEKIPYSGRSGKGGTSQYIQGLVRFWEGRGLSGREALGAAFATAAVHKRDGMPSRASSVFSKTGERTGFVKAVIDNNFEQISTKIQEKYRVSIELAFAEELKSYENIKFTA